MSKSPLVIYNTGDKYGEYFNLNSPYMVTIEECLMDSSHLYHSMISPGFTQYRDWSLLNVYSPDMRPLHRHDSIEFMYVKRGKVVQYIEDFQCAYLNISNEDYIFNRILIYLEKKDGRIDYNELESLLGYTRDYLNRIVKKRSGISLIKYGQKVCIERAAQLLAQTDIPVSDIVNKLGYTNRSYFNRIFINEYGITPSEYRKNA